MLNIEEYNFINEIYPIYRNLLTQKQIDVMDRYFIYNLSLREISEELNISRTAVLDNISHSKKKLINFEEKLKIYEKRLKIIEIIEKNTEKNVIKNKIEELFDYGI